MSHDDIEFDPDPDFYERPPTPSRERRAPEEKPQPPVEIPADALSKEALQGLLEAFVLREGTDYGSVEVSIETKIQQVRKQLDRGEIKIAFDPGSESVTLLTAQEWRNRLLAHT